MLTKLLVECVVYAIGSWWRWKICIEKDNLSYGSKKPWWRDLVVLPAGRKKKLRCSMVIVHYESKKNSLNYIVLFPCCAALRLLTLPILWKHTFLQKCLSKSKQSSNAHTTYHRMGPYAPCNGNDMAVLMQVWLMMYSRSFCINGPK